MPPFVKEDVTFMRPFQIKLSLNYKQILCLVNKYLSSDILPNAVILVRPMNQENDTIYHLKYQKLYIQIHVWVSYSYSHNFASFFFNPFVVRFFFCSSFSNIFSKPPLISPVLRIRCRISKYHRRHL